METLTALLHSKQGTSNEMQDIRIQSSINTNLQNVNVVASANNLGYINDGSSKSCSKCHELYNSLNQHFLESHSNDLNNDKDSTSILKNILTSILALLTASNKTDQEPGQDKAIPNLSQPSTPVPQKAATPTNELPQLGSLVAQESVASHANLEKLLKSAQLNSSRNVEQGGGEQEKRKTVLQGISLLDAAGVQMPGSIPLVFANQLSRDGSSHPAMVAASALPKTSEKSDLDVADILVNKMPIPSVNKEESSLAQLYLKQLAEGLATGRPDILKDTEVLTDNIVSDRDLLNALLNFNNSTGCSIAAGPTNNANQKPMVETITQIMAAQKQLTNLLSLLGKRQNETPLLPVAGLATQLIETPLNNPLFVNQQQRAAPPGMLQIPLSSILPALAPASQGIIQGSLIQQQAAANAANNTIPLANLFARTTQAFPASSTNKTIAVPALALPTSLLQSSAIPILQQTIQTSLQSTTQPTVLMSSVLPAAISSSIPTTLFSTQTSLQSLIVPGKSITGSTQSSSPKTFFTLPQTTIPSLTEQLFQNASSIPKLALSTTLPSVFNLGNIPGISVLNAGLQSQSQTRLQGGVTTRPIPLAPSTSVIVSSGTQHANQAIDKIQGLIHAAVNNPKKPTAIVTSPSFNTTSNQNRGLFPKRKSSTLGTSPVKILKIDASESREKTDPTKLYRCQTCHTTFSVLSTLQHHEQSHLGTKMQCNYCNDVFSDVSTFQEHISLHRGQENVHQCEYCSKIFTSRGELQKHLVEHTQKRPYKCTYCAKSFRDPGSLQKHERIHTGERPYKCTECSRAFAEYSSLRKHNRVHTGEKPYKCTHCPKAFSISGNLQRHLYIHTGERPYRCTKCPKAFNNPSHLRRHVKNLHEWKKEGSASTQGSDDELEVAPIDAE